MKSRPAQKRVRKDAVTSQLSDSNYVSERSDPRPGETLYLHLSDLARAIYGIPLPPQGARMLDFGCGGSPYQHHFSGVEYLRADFEASLGLDFVIRPDGTVPAESNSFDMILSTQVLEHVEDVDRHLRECRRLLRPGGKLVVTTHGTFEDHPCPDDFWRWTAGGLRCDLETAGFEVPDVRKLTTNARALAFLLRTSIGALASARRLPFGILFWSVSRVLRVFPQSFDQWCDRHFPDCRAVPAAIPGHDFYIALMAVAIRRP
jgi:SAM-dependent methyltransferase